MTRKRHPLGVALEALGVLAAHQPMTPAEREAQRRSFAYGNAALSNPNVTRELVDKVADEMAQREAVELAGSTVEKQS